VDDAAVATAFFDTHQRVFTHSLTPRQLNITIILLCTMVAVVAVITTAVV